MPTSAIRLNGRLEFIVMPRYTQTDEQDDLSISVALLSKLVEFAEMQAREGLIDGACDPSIYVDAAKDMISKYGEPLGDDLAYAMEA